MNKRILVKIGLPVAVLGLGVVGMSAITATAEQGEEKEVVDTRPTVKVETVVTENYQVVIRNFGEVQPLESTQLAAQVSGEVVSWNPNFIAGGLVKRGDVLFSIERDTYEAALLQAEAEVSLAKSQLIEEEARAEVARQEAKNLPSSKVSDLYLRKPQVISAKARVKSAEAQLKIAKRDLENCDVLSPYDALVVSRDIGVGQFVAQGSTVGVLNNVEAAEIRVPVAGFDNGFLPDSMFNAGATVVSKGFNAISRQGKVVRDLGMIDSATRMSNVVVRVTDPYSLNGNQPALKFGSYVEVSFAGKTLEQVVKLPQDLVNNRTVWVLDQEDRMQPRKVDIVREEGEFFLISSGLTLDDQVIMTLPEYPQKDMEVKVAGQNVSDLVTASVE